MNGCSNCLFLIRTDHSNICSFILTENQTSTYIVTLFLHNKYKCTEILSQCSIMLKFDFQTSSESLNLQITLSLYFYHNYHSYEDKMFVEC